jgi:hypothetical protein
MKRLGFTLEIFNEFLVVVVNFFFILIFEENFTISKRRRQVSLDS